MFKLNIFLEFLRVQKIGDLERLKYVTVFLNKNFIVSMLCKAKKMPNNADAVRLTAFFAKVEKIFIFSILFRFMIKTKQRRYKAMTDRLFYTVGEALDMIFGGGAGMTKTTLAKLVESGEVPGKKLGKRYYVCGYWVRDMLKLAAGSDRQKGGE